MKIIEWTLLTEPEREIALRRPAFSLSADIKEKVAAILTATRERGDAAILEFTSRFDGVSLKSIAVEPQDIRQAYNEVSPSSFATLKEAARRIRVFHQTQLPQNIRKEISPGIVCERRFTPIQKVGLYVPGGSASLPSTVLMLGVPAQIARCPLKVLASPPRPDGSMDPHVLVAADIVGLKRMYKMGGAQAVAALAYGTASVPKVDKIFGPGNPWVTEAKMQVCRDPLGAACDLPAGPSEVLVIAGLEADPEFAAADLLAQAEHGPDSQVVLVTPSIVLARQVAEEIDQQVSELPRRLIAIETLKKSMAIVVSDLETAFEVSNRYAPEHLILHLKEPKTWAARVRNAGSVFLGFWSPEAAGDYATGTNHVLPTYGFARSYGGLTVENFMKSMTFQELSPKGLMELGPVVERLADIEALEAHKRSVSRRLKRLGALI